MFNVPEIPVVILSAGAAANQLSKAARARRWISVVSTGERVDLQLAARRLRSEFGLTRISAIGGRSAATSLIDARLVRDLYLTTSPISAGQPGTPMYAGNHPPARALAVRKQSSTGVVFEHLLLQ